VPKQEKREEFGSEWCEPPDLLPIGGKWVYAVGLVRERGSDVLRLRIAKGKVKGYTKRNPQGMLEAFPDNPLDPLTQPNRLNIKTAEEWRQLAKLVEKWLHKIPQARPKRETPAEEENEATEE